MQVCLPQEVVFHSSTSTNKHPPGGSSACHDLFSFFISMSSSSIAVLFCLQLRNSACQDAFGNFVAQYKS